ncbi:hypothetical protein PIB30_098239 [Stylosanthes scabra]|uniref:Uncharacterized protein n=1 Tax=Stylosanthes scabra TaxID=79078 RepID=A0ABU6TZ14_9FABA|nr:hypothetical protein [Stylosanthes scabra]
MKVNPNSRKHGGADDERILVTRALRSDISRCSRFISTHELWPTGIHRKAVFWITKAEVKMEFPSEFFDAFGHHFHSHIYLIDVKDNCLVLSVGKDDNSMWLPRESLCLIRNFYNLGVRATGDGETIELTVGNAYSTSSRVHKKLFKFKLVRNSSQRNAYLFGGEWCDFCNAYRQSLNRKCQLKILSVEDRLIQASFG